MTTSTNDRQTSERERLATVVDELGSANVPQWSTHKAADQLRANEAEIAELKSRLMERHSVMRDLDAEIVQLRAENGRLLRERASEDVRLADVIAERDRLRAENEALRTVTEEDVEAFSNALWEGDHMQYVRDNYRRKATGALQSFIRSKESRRQ